MRKFLFWFIWILELILFVISGFCVLLYISYEEGIGAIFFLFLACGVVMLYGLSKAFTSQKEQARPSRLAYYLALPLIAAFVGYGSCFTVL